ncbi:MAG: hypothetical protein JXR95_15860 [Deltaproteobacteria bacterium]|nr:hypothetical protein [Deltaproteobacteria bacterium]
MKSALYFFKISILFFFIASGCTENPTLNFELLVPENSVFFQDLTSVTVTLDDKVKVYPVENGFLSFDAKFASSYGNVTRLEIKGKNSSDEVTAWGRTPLFTTVESSWTLGLYFGEVNTIGQLHSEVSFPCSDTSAVKIYTGTGNTPDDILGHFFIGGTMDGTILDTVSYYDPYFHAPYQFDPLPFGIKNTNVMVVSTSIILFYGGIFSDNTFSDKLYYYDSGCSYSCGASELTWGDDSPPALAGAVVLPLGPFEDFVDDYDGRELISAFALMGGETPDGPYENILLVTAWLDSLTQAIVIEQREIQWDNSRTDFTAQVTNRGTDEISIAVYGGENVTQLITLNIEDNPDGITFSANFNEIDSEFQPLNPRSIVTQDNTFIFMGGITADGTMVDKVYALNPERMELEEMSAKLSRTDFSIASIGDTIVAAGGICEQGLCENAVILKVFESDTGIDVENDSVTSLQTPRINPMLYTLSTGNIAISGGTDSDDNCVKSLELYTPQPQSVN